MRKPLIVLQTDFSNTWSAVATMKGVIKCVDPELEIFDLTHDIKKFDPFEASLSLVTTEPYWPKGTIFVSVVDPTVGSERKASAALLNDGNIVISPDNGSFTHLKKTVGIREIREKVGKGRVLLGLSGGVDSSVAAGLLARAIGKQLTCVFVDHGLLRKNEGDEVEAVFGKGGNFREVHARKLSLGNSRYAHSVIHKGVALVAVSEVAQRKHLDLFAGKLVLLFKRLKLLFRSFFCAGFLERGVSALPVILRRGLVFSLFGRRHALDHVLFERAVVR